MAENTAKRIAYIDWVRGFACLAMFQTHCYDSWLTGAARDGKFFRYSQDIGTLPAPLFLFLAGVSCALVTDKLRRKGIGADEIARTTIWRGGEVFLLGLLFRMQEYLLGLFHAPWTDLLRVDILNIIGLSLMMAGLACRIAAADGDPDASTLRKRSIGIALGATAAIAILTPLLWTVWQPHWRAWWLESYINGVHTYGTPQSWLFPMFPWSAFAFAGLAVGFLLQSEWARQKETAVMILLGASGLALVALGIWLDTRPLHLYAVYDYWRTSPNFFLVRTGIVMTILFLGYAWCRWGRAQRGFSPLIELGKSSLLVYWVHMEFVYGGLSILPKHRVGIGTATIGLLAIFTAMTALAYWRNRFQGRPAEIVPEIVSFFRRTVAPE
jgi:uncharacterized membrane protein